MSERRTEPGEPMRITIEAGPFTVYGFGKRDIAATERRLRDAIDRSVRDYVGVGPRSKVVRTRIERETT